MRNNLVGLVVGLAISVIVIGSILMPSIEDATTTHKTFDNTDYALFQMKEVEVGDVWAYNDGDWTYNDKTLENLPATDTWRNSVLATDTFVYRQNGQTRGIDTASNAASSATADSETLMIIDDLGTQRNVAYTKGYGAVNEGEYIMKTYEDEAYVFGDTNLWVSGITSMASAANLAIFVQIEGTIDDGVTISATKVSGGILTIIETSNVVIHYEEVEGYKNLYKISKITFDVIASDGETQYSNSLTYSTFVLPKEVDAELSQHMTDAEISMISIIPVVVILALVVTAAYAITRRD